jgi:hypothetical protein
MSVGSDAYLFGKDGKLIWKQSFNTSANVVSLSANARYIAVGTGNGVSLLDRSGSLLWNYGTDLVEGVSLTVNGSYVAAVVRNTTYYRGGPETLYYWDGRGHLLWTREGFGLPFSFSADTGYAMGSSSVFDRGGNQILSFPESAGPTVLSSDGGFIAAIASVQKLIFVHMMQTALTTTATSTAAGTATSAPSMNWQLAVMSVAGVLLISLTLLWRKRRK